MIQLNEIPINYVIASIIVVGLGYYLLNINDKKVKTKKVEPELTEEERHIKKLNSIKADSEGKIELIYPKFITKLDLYKAGEKTAKLKEEIKLDHVKLSELLLTNLIKLDDIECTHLPEVRSQRKLVIKFIQEKIKEIDQLWAEIKED
ncbi:hypothetical protein K502DRAFT_362710 [Neoconidiobolus thromboides FSU 785]|nr:hypothetical protein K502DRAFT_362710 [Neoconidiobolus thromboides FSU 785]